ncbi:MAG: hypothetical protein RL088_585 [Verrucomicrobiota bacterium]|jgi:hypothetical protein
MTVSDLSPDALARLEAKLLADLEVVRKVRALLVEHREALGLGAGGSVGVVATGGKTESVAAPVTGSQVGTGMENRVEPVAVVRRPLAEVMMDVLRGMPSEGFHLKEFKRGVSRETGNVPRDTTVKSFFNQMIRKGTVVIAKSFTGRRGNLYRCTLPASVPADSSSAPGEIPQAADGSSDGGEVSPGEAGENPPVPAV